MAVFCSIQSIFKAYKNVVFSVQTDLNFSKSLLAVAIRNFDDPKFKDIYQAGFSVYNLPKDGCNGRSKMFKEIRQIGMGELESFKINFENWIDNISLVKVYNAMEIFLWQAIWWKDFQTFKNPSYDKKSMDSIVNLVVFGTDINNLSASTGRKPIDHKCFFIIHFL